MSIVVLDSEDILFEVRTDSGPPVQKRGRVRPVGSKNIIGRQNFRSRVLGEESERGVVYFTVSQILVGGLVFEPEEELLN